MSSQIWCFPGGGGERGVRTHTHTNKHTPWWPDKSLRLWDGATKKFSLNLYQTKFGAITFWVGGQVTIFLGRSEKKISFWICIKPNLVLSHFGSVGVRSQEQNYDWMCIKPNLVSFHSGWLRGKIFGSNLYQSKSGVISFSGEGCLSGHKQTTNRTNAEIPMTR